VPICIYGETLEGVLPAFFGCIESILAAEVNSRELG